MGAERGVNCEHMQALLTTSVETSGVAGRSPGLLGTRIFNKYKTAFVASLDVKTACDVARPAVISRVLSLRAVHGHVVAALLTEMQDVQGSACFETCETEFRYPGCIRQGGVEALVLWERVAKHVFWKAEENGRPGG